MDSSITFGANNNSGNLVGINYGSVYFNSIGHPNDSGEVRTLAYSTEYSPRAQSQDGPTSTIPFYRDIDFIERSAIFDQISSSFSVPVFRVALVGLGGVGKSQIAIEYAYRTREKSPQTWVFWIHGSSFTRFEDGYRVIATRLGLLKQHKTQAQTNYLQLAFDWLSDERKGPWLMIVDNADDASVFFGSLQPNAPAGEPGIRHPSLDRYLPQTSNGRIIFTSRSREVALRLVQRPDDIVEVPPMTEPEALQLLQKRLKQSSANPAEASELVQKLEYIPLAITHAAAYINKLGGRGSVSKYLQQFSSSEKSMAKLLTKPGLNDMRRDSEANSSVMITWQMSFEQIQKERPSAARLLSLMSFFNRQGIPHFVLRGYNSDSEDKKPKSDEGESDSDDEDESEEANFDEDMVTLTGYSLVTADETRCLFDMHRLVQFATKRWLRSNKQIEFWKNAFIVALSTNFPASRYENWERCKLLFPHAEAAAAEEPSGFSASVDWAKLLDSAGLYACADGRYAIAEGMARKTIKLSEQLFGPAHFYLDGGMCLDVLGASLKHQGRYEAAEEVARRAVVARDRLFDQEYYKDHPSILVGEIHLGMALQLQGKYKESEVIFRRVLEVRMKTFGPEHPDTLTSLTDLANLLCYQGRYQEAEETINEKTIEVSRRTLGEEHPNTLAMMLRLAHIRDGQGRYEAAEELARRTLRIQEKLLRKNHPGLLGSMSTLIGVLHHQGKYKDAEQMARQVIELASDTLGKEHPETLASMGYLASVLKIQGKYASAEEISRSILESSIKVVGEKHPSTLLKMTTLGGILRYQRKYEEAERINRRALTLYEQLLGKMHPHTLACMANLAVILFYEGKYDAAEELGRQALEGREIVHGKEHYATLASIGNLAAVLESQGNYTEAEAMKRRALEGKEKALGREHYSTLTSMHSLAQVLQQQEKYEAAEKMYRSALEGREKVLGGNHQLTLKTMGSLVEVLQKLGSHDAAEDLHQRLSERGADGGE